MSCASIFLRLMRDRSATAATELVLILPLATLMILVTIEGGYFMYTEHEVVKSVRDAARWGSRQALSTFGCTAATADTEISSGDANLGSIRDNISTLARYGSLSSSGAKVVNGWADSQVKVLYGCQEIDTGIYASGGYAPTITVIGNPSYPTLFGSMTYFSSSLKLYAAQQAVVVGV